METIEPGQEMLEVSGAGLNLMDFTRTADAYEAGWRQGQVERRRDWRPSGPETLQGTPALSADLGAFDGVGPARASDLARPRAGPGATPPNVRPYAAVGTVVRMRSNRVRRIAVALGDLLAAALVAAVVAGCGSTGPDRSSSPATSPTTSRSVSSAAPGPSTSVPCSVRSVIEHWPVARRAAAVIAAPVFDYNMATVAAALSAGVGGLLLLGGASPPASLGSQLGSTISRERPSLPPLVMADQEGGGIQRLTPVTAIPWPRVMADHMTAGQIEQLATTVGGQMRALGVNVDLAPCSTSTAGTVQTPATPTDCDLSALFRPWPPGTAWPFGAACKPAG